MRLGLILIAMFTLVASAQAKEVTIGQKDKKFLSPDGRGPATAAISVKLGDAIKFVNNDSFQHNVYSLSAGNSFELKTQDPGKSSTVTLDAAKFKGGEMMVECAIHPEMKIKFTIEK